MDLQLPVLGCSRTFSPVQIIRSIVSMQRLALRRRRAGIRIGLVPTMGYLHAGHLSLVKHARKRVGPKGQIVLSIYVNPTQFGPKEDFSRYPRDLKRDLKLCREAGVDVVFVPSDAEMYPDRINGGYSTYVTEQKLSQSMEGAARPGHFQGVATVVAKLFNLVLPDVAVFGQKDFQQAAILKRMTRDLNFPLKLVVAPTLRESDGLAMSSRNKYLNPEQRDQAVILYHALRTASTAVKLKPVSATRLRADLKQFMTAAPLARLDYVEFFDPESLEPVAMVKRGTHMALAVFFGKTRLIDNARL